MAVVSWGAGRKKTLTIPQSGTETDILDMGSLGRRGAYRVAVLSPEALTGTITIDVSDIPAGPFRTLQSDNVDVTIAADKAAVLSPIPFPYLRFVSSAGEAADRDIIIMAHFG